MSDRIHKKRKRTGDDTNETSRPRKSRLVESDPGHITNGAGLEQKPDEDLGSQPAVSSKESKNSGRSRQEKSERRSKKSKRSKEEKSPEKIEQLEVDNLDSKGTVSVPAASSDHQTSKKDSDSLIAIPKPAKKKSSKPKIDPIPSDQVIPAEPTATTTTTKPSRFIVFVGNLPYTSTTPQILSHFSKIAPSSVRHNTDKSTGRSKGFAFLEFDGYDKMKTALKLYHHSIFDPSNTTNGEVDGAARGWKSTPAGKAAAPAGRRINVELTAGGGGAGKQRKDKIRGKNAKLEEERERTRVKEKHAKDKGKTEGQGTDANATAQLKEEVVMAERGRGDIHPSRLARVARS